MDVEIRLDDAARRRHRRGTLLFLAAVVLYVPAAILALKLVAVVFGREAASQAFNPMTVAWLLALATAAAWSTRDSLIYRCPQCGRRLPKVEPRDEAEPNVHYYCADCGVAWDLGWGWGSGGGAGGG